jgi:phosphatidylglycerophosphate synthase
VSPHLRFDNGCAHLTTRARGQGSPRGRPLGLLLLLGALATPVVAGLRARSVPLMPAVLAAYLAFLVHASVDWDWEMASITITAIVLSVVLLVASRQRQREVPLGTRPRLAVIVPALALAGLCIVALVGNRAQAAALDASLAGRWSDAESHARTAVRWQPWSSDARMLLGRALGGEGRLGAARATLRRAIERDPDEWTLWFELARWSEGAAVTRALERAEALNPASVEVAQFRDALRGR